MQQPSAGIVIILTSMFVAVSCGRYLEKEARYLSSATDHATQDQVRQELGPPRSVSTDKDGQSVWIYQTRDTVLEGSDATIATETDWCDDYTLTFDGKGVLRHWRRQSQRCVDTSPKRTSQPASS